MSTTFHRFLCYLFSNRKWIDPINFSCDLDGLQGYLDAHGVRHFTADEITQVHHDILLSGDAKAIGSQLRQWGRGEKAESAVFVEALIEEVSQLPKYKGVPIALPMHAWWPRLCAVTLVADKIRETIGMPVTWINGWRAPLLNAAVGGAKLSGHLGAYACDIRVHSQRSRTTAEHVLRRLLAVSELGMSVGWGHRRLHIGFDEKGHREWTY